MGLLLRAIGPTNHEGPGRRSPQGNTLERQLFSGRMHGSALPGSLPGVSPILRLDTRSVTYRSAIRMSTDAAVSNDPPGRDDCPVLPCVPYTAINADRLCQDALAGPSDTDVGRSRQLTAALVVISTAQLMVVLDATIVTVALPSIQKALHFSTANLQWIVTAYTLTFGGLLLLGGRLGDVFGRRRMFVCGLVVFSLASFVGGLATTSGWLIAARAVQGLGGAIAAPTALALIGDTFPEGPARTRATGVYAAMSGAGGAVGLLLGGILTDFASWRWVLFVNAPIGAMVVVAAPRVLKRSAPRGGKLD